MVKKDEFGKDLDNKINREAGNIKDDGKIDVVPVDTDKSVKKETVVEKTVVKDDSKVNVVPVEDIDPPVPFWKKPWLWLLLGLLLLGLLAWALGWFGGNKDTGTVTSTTATEVVEESTVASTVEETTVESTVASTVESTVASGSASTIPAHYEDLKVGDEATIQNFATNYDNGAVMPEDVKGQTYKITDVKEVDHDPSQRAYKLEGVDGWVLEQDINPNAEADINAVREERASLPVDQKRAGDLVTVQEFATNYQDTTVIPDDVKGQQYVLQEIVDEGRDGSSKTYILEGLDKGVLAQDIK